MKNFKLLLFNDPSMESNLESEAPDKDRVLFVDMEEHPYNKILINDWWLIVNWHYMCQRSDKCVDHMLLHCPAGKELWDLVAMFRVKWVMPKMVTGLLQCWQRPTYLQCRAWNIIPACLVWQVLRERNGGPLTGRNHV